MLDCKRCISQQNVCHNLSYIKQIGGRKVKTKLDNRLSGILILFENISSFWNWTRLPHLDWDQAAPGLGEPEQGSWEAVLCPRACAVEGEPLDGTGCVGSVAAVASCVCAWRLEPSCACDWTVDPVGVGSEAFPSATWRVVVGSEGRHLARWCECVWIAWQGRIEGWTFGAPVQTVSFVQWWSGVCSEGVVEPSGPAGRAAAGSGCCWRFVVGVGFVVGEVKPFWRVWTIFWLWWIF